MAGIPEFRKGQGIVPYGVGAIVDFPDDSLMAAGLDMWPQCSQGTSPEKRERLIDATQIVDGRLQKRLTGLFNRRINRLLSPAEAPERNPSFASSSDANADRAFMPFVRFPKWHFCPRCRTLWDVPWNTPSGSKELRCHSMVRLKEGSAKKCGELHEKRRPHLIPVRFAVACPSGHIMDFPWHEWAHMHSSKDCNAGSGKLFLVSTGAAGLAGVQVICSSCGARNTMRGAFDQHRNPFEKIWGHDCCPGERPWLGPDAVESNCTERPVTIQRGASNSYFASTMNSILIPPYSKLLRKILDDPKQWSLIEVLFNSQPTVDGEISMDTPQLLNPLREIAKNHGVDPDAFIQAAIEKLGLEKEDIGEAISEEEYRSAEYKAFLGPRPPHSERRDFDVVQQDITHYSEIFQRYFKKVVMIPRLRETRALIGFGRIVPPGGIGEGAQLSIKPLDWFPATEVRGEGIFLTLRQSALEAWKNEAFNLSERVQTIRNRIEADEIARRRHGLGITAEFLLIHTLAHVLIRQLTYDCGYDSSSLRERIYVSSDDADTKMAGLLIYTASGDSEGTLGGLVRQGLPGRLDMTMKAAIANARLCSSDPLCIESEGQGINGLNLAACHACTLLPETSCETGNTLLDRAMLIGTLNNEGLGFFKDIS